MTTSTSRPAMSAANGQPEGLQTAPESGPFAEIGPIRPAPQHLAVATAIRRAIGLGRYGPGERLPPERDFAAALGVGRVTLRAALRMLRDDGLVATTYGRRGGTVVLGHERFLEHSRRELIERYTIDARANYEFRIAVEPAAAATACRRATDADCLLIRRLGSEPSATLSMYRSVDSQFHLAIGQASHNPFLYEAIHRARSEFFTWADVLWIFNETVSADTRVSDRQHHDIADAIFERDGGRAAAAMETHLVSSLEAFYTRL